MSSKYGIVTQDQVIEPYDAVMSGPAYSLRSENTEPVSTLQQKKEWGLHVVEQLRTMIVGYDEIDAYVSEVYFIPLPHPFPLPIRFLKANSRGKGLFKSLQKWGEIVDSGQDTETLLRQQLLVPVTARNMEYVEGHYKEDVTKVVNWIHPEYGTFTGCARDIAKKYHKDESNLKNVAIGKTKSSYGWRLKVSVREA